MAFELPALPYDQSALEPHITANTLSFHYGKHHQAYVTNLNNLVKDTPLADKSLEDIIKETAGNADKAGIFNNAAQIWNHTFYWHSMKPNGGGAPGGALAEKINSSFGSYDKFADAFSQAAATQFGSGWAWLDVDDDKKLKIVSTTNQNNPRMTVEKEENKGTPILGIDLWEHAYYLKYQNRRKEYITAFMNIIDWNKVGERYRGTVE